MNIAIITMTNGTNYGNRLQNCAVEYTISKLGHNNTTILKSTPDSSAVTKLKNKIKLFIGITPKYSYFRNKSFCNFNNKYLNYSKVSYKNVKSDFDYYVCGSDQIWNLEFSDIRDNTDYYFLGFAPAEKKIAFSASVATEKISDDNIELFRSSISDFKAISVREQITRDFISNELGIESICTIDPTLMLSKEEWRTFEKKVKIKDKYLLTYFLGDVSNELLTFIKTTAKENKLEIVNLYDSRFCPSTKKEKKEYAFSPSEFLWLVDNCEFFITDSYHGCVFSTIFEKPFRWFARKQDNQCDMNCRIKTLFLKLGLGDCCVGDINEKICNIQNIDYSLTKKHIEDEQKIVYDFLERAFT